MSDIHGNFYPMIRLLTYVNYRPEHDQLVIVGDMIDRGPDSVQVLNQLYSLSKRYPKNVTVLQGNHEDMMGMFFAGATDQWLSFGGTEIIHELETIDESVLSGSIDSILTWALTRPVLHDDGEYIYVHAGIDPNRMLDNQDRNEMIWMPYSHSGINFNYVPPEEILKTTYGKKVIYGHTPRGYVFDDGAKMGIDGGAGVKEDGELRLIDLTNDKVYSTFAGTEVRDITSATQVYERKIARKKVKA